MRLTPANRRCAGNRLAASVRHRPRESESMTPKLIIGAVLVAVLVAVGLRLRHASEA
jgi:hypothetical protein